MAEDLLELPAVEQAILDEAPLEQVVCQLRFNEILIINDAPPALFQEKIRVDFPIYATGRGLQIDLSRPQPVISTDTPNWQFTTKDQQWTVSLTSKFLALKTTAYGDYSNFASRLKPVVEAFEALYQPPFYTRVGLRYVNRFHMEREGDSPVEWNRYLHQRVASEYGDPVLRTLISESNHQVVLKLKHGNIGWRWSREIGNSDGKATERFTLDLDHFLGGEISPSNVSELLTKFNHSLYRLFRMCLTEEGYDLFKPRLTSDRLKGGS